MLVTKEFTFDAAHYLTNYYGKCEKMHGHTYRLQVTLEGKVQENGLVIDFVVIKEVVKKYVLEKLDHTLLNDVIENPSAERVVMWIWDHLNNLEEFKFDKELHLVELKLWETPNSFVTFNGK